MIDRAEAQRLLASIISNADVAATLLKDPTMTDRDQELELAARLNYVDARLAQLRSLMLKSGRPDKGHLRALSGRAEVVADVLATPPSGDAA